MILDPIEEKIRFWIQYEKNLPQIPYKGNEIFFDEYRSIHDRDCQLLGGSLSADTIFSLWLPLQYTLERCNPDIEAQLGVPRKRQMFLQKLLNAGLDHFLPPDEQAVKLLSELFVRGQGRENVMLLSNRGLNMMRSVAPYHDYMPHFLVECFQGGKFAHIFNFDLGLLRFWLIREDLQGFFQDEYLIPEAILDLAGTDDVRNGVPPTSGDRQEDLANLSSMLEDYIAVLQERAQRMAETTV